MVGAKAGDQNAELPYEWKVLRPISNLHCAETWVCGSKNIRVPNHLVDCECSMCLSSCIGHISNPNFFLGLSYLFHIG
jgi:hypothetical protein